MFRTVHNVRQRKSALQTGRKDPNMSGEQKQTKTDSIEKRRPQRKGKLTAKGDWRANSAHTYVNGTGGRTNRSEFTRGALRIAQHAVQKRGGCILIGVATTHRTSGGMNGGQARLMTRRLRRFVAEADTKSLVLILVRSGSLSRSFGSSSGRDGVGSGV